MRNAYFSDRKFWFCRPPKNFCNADRTIVFTELWNFFFSCLFGFFWGPQIRIISLNSYSCPVRIFAEILRWSAKLADGKLVTTNLWNHILVNFWNIILKSYFRRKNFKKSKIKLKKITKTYAFQVLSNSCIF